MTNSSDPLHRSHNLKPWKALGLCLSAVVVAVAIGGEASAWAAGAKKSRATRMAKSHECRGQLVLAASGLRFIPEDDHDLLAIPLDNIGSVTASEDQVQVRAEGRKGAWTFQVADPEEWQEAIEQMRAGGHQPTARRDVPDEDEAEEESSPAPAPRPNKSVAKQLSGWAQAAWMSMEFEVPAGWTVSSMQENLTATSSDPNMMLLVTGASGVQPSALDQLIQAGPMLPMHSHKLIGSVEGAAQPFLGWRAASYETTPPFGNAFRMRYIVIASVDGVYMVMGKASTQQFSTIKTAVDHLFVSMKMSEAAQAAVVQHLVAQQQAQQAQTQQSAQAWSLYAGSYEWSRGQTGNSTWHTLTLCPNGYYFWRERVIVSEVVGQAMVSPKGNGSGHWKVVNSNIIFEPGWMSAKNAKLVFRADMEQGQNGTYASTIQIANATLRRTGPENVCNNTPAPPASFLAQ